MGFMLINMGNAGVRLEKPRLRMKWKHSANNKACIRMQEKEPSIFIVKLVAALLRATQNARSAQFAYAKRAAFTHTESTTIRWHLNAKKVKF